VLVYAGVDPVTGKDSYLTESTTDEKKIPEIRTRLLAQVDRQRNAATKATLEYTITAWLDVHDAEDSTIDNYKGMVERNIVPALGDVPISKLGARSLEQFYAQLRKCRDRCNGQAYIEHRTTEPHECRTVQQHRWPPGRPSAKARAEHDCATAGCRIIECKTHECKPLSSSAIRQIHLHHQRSTRCGCQVGLDLVKPGRECEEAEAEPSGPEAADTRGGGPDRRGGMGTGRGLGHVRLAEDAQRRPARRATCAPLARCPA